MKNTYKLSALAFTISLMFGLTSCGEPERYTNGPSMANEKMMQNVVTYCEKHEIFDNDDDIVKIVFKQKDGRGVTKYTSAMDVYCYSGDVDSVLQVRVFLQKEDEWLWKEENAYKSGYNKLMRENGVKFADIDFMIVPQSANEAGELVKAIGEEYEEPVFYSGIGDYTMLFEKDAKNPLCSFTIQSKDTVKSTKFTDYYDYFEFEYHDGELELLD